MLFLDWKLSLVAFALLPVFVLLDAPRRRAAARDHAREAGLAGRHLDARRGVALGLGRDARQDDGPERRAHRALPRRVGAAGRAGAAPAHGRALGHVVDPDDVRGHAGAHLRRRRPRHGRRLGSRSRSARSSPSRPCRRGSSSPSGACSACRPTCSRRSRSSTASSSTSTCRSTSRSAPTRSNSSASDVRGEVRLEHVSFAYEPGRPVLQDVSFTAEPGSKVAIVGETGSGKTTLGYLIARLYDVSEGAVLLDGHDVRDLSFATLRRDRRRRLAGHLPVSRQRAREPALRPARCDRRAARAGGRGSAHPRPPGDVARRLRHHRRRTRLPLLGR